ncbi:MAG: nucleotide exchange factor GrpE [Syntrophomonadaceae bacterium]|jgi:molecular chaperone GrpE|nr:nucleotide exchange factor GrpE [Syntrophomonadaceae bacterium]
MTDEQNNPACENVSHTSGPVADSPEEPLETAGAINAGEADEEEMVTISLKELDDLKTSAGNSYEQYLRTLAEAENNKKRAAREREEYIKYANIALVKKIIPIMDDLERALKLSQEKNDFEQFYKGVEMISKGLSEAVKSEGVEAIAAQGQEFNPEFHEPLIIEANSELASNMVVEELQRGYIMHGRVVRPSLVKVSE